MTRLQRLRYSRPHLWAALAFVPFVLISVIVFPLAVVYDFICECPRIFRNFWWDVKSAFRDVVHDGMNVMRPAWTNWWDAVNGNRRLKRLMRLSERKGRPITNAEVMKTMEEGQNEG